MLEDMKADEILERVQAMRGFTDLVGRAAGAPSGLGIVRECLAVASFLVDKNKLYGDSALNPSRIFSKANPVEQIRVRIDDKLNRLMKGQGKETEDIIGDLLGYLVLLRVAERRHGSVSKADEYSPYLSGPDSPWDAVQALAVNPISTTATDEYFAEVSDVIRPTRVVSGAACQECGESVEENVVVCDVCFDSRFKRAKIDNSHVQG